MPTSRTSLATSNKVVDRACRIYASVGGSGKHRTSKPAEFAFNWFPGAISLWSVLKSGVLRPKKSDHTKETSCCICTKYT